MRTIATNDIRSDILNSKQFSFDWHGGTITRALGHPLLSGALRMVSPLATRMVVRIVFNQGQYFGLRTVVRFEPLD